MKLTFAKANRMRLAAHKMAVGCDWLPRVAICAAAGGGRLDR